MLTGLLAAAVIGPASPHVFAVARFGGYDLLGAYSKGKWLDAERAKPLWKPGQRDNAVFGLLPGRNRNFTLGKLQETPYATLGGDLTPEAKEEIGAWFFIQSEKIPVHRRIYRAYTTYKPYRQSVSEALRKKRLRVSNARLTQALKADLDGDGVLEVILAARSRGTIIEQKKGDYSAVVARVTRNGKTRTMPLVVNTYGRGIQRTPLEDSTGADLEIAGILDLNGDGRLEVVTVADMYESFEYRVFTFDGMQFKQVLKMGGGV